MKSLACALLAIVVLTGHAAAKACDHPGALGTSRTLKVQSSTTAGLGHGYPPLGLAHGEIIMTFDDGPLPTTTPRILDILARECIEATFFMIGKRAEAHPDIAARMRAAGHTIGSHSYTHRDLSKLSAEDATEDIRRGYEAAEKAAFGAVKDRPRLFRFPNFRSTPDLIAFVRTHHGVVVNANISAQDWRGQAAEVTMERLRKLFDRGNDRGILVFHDSQMNTVNLLPMVIAEMKARHMRIVHLVAE